MTHSASEQNLSKDTRGAILVLGVVIGALLVGALWHIAGIGDAIAWRERAQDAADAGAFENAVWNARGMNVIVAINIVMSLVLAVLVIWRTILILVTVALIIAAVLCVVTLGTGCGFAGAVARVESFMLRNDTKVATNIVRILSAMNAMEVAVASATPVVGFAQATSNTNGSYDVSYMATQSASLLPSINPKGVQQIARCLKGVRAGKMPPKEKPTSKGGKAWENYQTFISQPRMGIGFSLPVQTESYSLLCQKAGESVLNNIAGVLERMGVPAGAIEGIDKAKGVLGAVVGSLPGVFCAPSGGTPPGIADQLRAEAANSCNSELDNNRVIVGDSQGNNEIQYRDKDGKLVNKDDYLKKCTKDKKDEVDKKLKDKSLKTYELTECGSPAKVWEWAVNGNVFMRSFAQVEKDTPMATRDDKGLEVADGSRSGNVQALEQEQITAHAEIYFDCDQKWMGCKSNAMWALRWRARLRRVQPFDRLAATAIEPGIVATLTQIFNAGGGKLGDRLTDKFGIPTILVPHVKDTWYFRQLKTRGVMGGLYGSNAFEGIGAFVIAHSGDNVTIH